ncbi:Arc family DNA-binding protein [Glaciimonas sp. PAMC28666]|uniref:Arc family DNA-binding protein n=1 Tax=Glaciimonas sp. PAMC28666 TaxID=2807626 RepID=UPI001964FCA3|nr:Arc family DNA-binding protein [Glaciimonas sp. PAMC28666]QRX83278.1 Arc family DNA-binding protein [Glaciimonas sp. PAMC28666]
MENSNKSAKLPISNVAPFGLRMQPELKAQLQAAADRNERSMNSEITARLNQSFELIAGLKDAEINALAEKIATRLGEKIKK